MSKNIEKNTLLEEFLLSLTDKNWSESNYLNVIKESSSSEAAVSYTHLTLPTILLV